MTSTRRPPPLPYFQIIASMHRYSIIFTPTDMYLPTLFKITVMARELARGLSRFIHTGKPLSKSELSTQSLVGLPPLIALPTPQTQTLYSPLFPTYLSIIYEKHFPSSSWCSWQVAHSVMVVCVHYSESGHTHNAESAERTVPRLLDRF